MNAFVIGSIVSYQGRCWLVTRTMGTWLHLVTATTHGSYHSIDLPQTHVTQNLTATESSHHQMYCPFIKKKQ